MWYVIQTTAGHEEAVRSEVSLLIPEADFKVIYRIGKYNYKGKWISKKMVMFPSYLFALTDDIEIVIKNIRKVTDFAKLVKLGEEYLPVSEEEQEFLESLIGNGVTVEESFGFIEGDKIIVKKGPLKGRESRIVRVDRHKRLAYVEFEMGTRKVETQLCLNVLEKKQTDEDQTYPKAHS